MLLAGKGVGPQGRGPDPLLFAGAIEIRLDGAATDKHDIFT